MDMCYDGALVMPGSYAVMDEEEMMYVEGGRTNSFRTTAGKAYSYCVSSCWALRLMACEAGCVIAALGTWIGNVPGIIIGVAGGLVVGNFVWGWSDAYSSASNVAASIKKKYGKNQKVKVTETLNACLNMTVSIKKA